MITEKDKAKRIMKEIVSYYLDNGFTDLAMDFAIDETKFKFVISAEADDVPETFDHLLEALNTPRQIEVDEYFNALLGSHSHDHDYSFLGKAVDCAIGALIDGRLSLEVIRYAE